MLLKNRNITMIRGDTESLTVKCFDKTGSEKLPVPFAEGDTVYMTVRKTAESPVLFQITVTEFDAEGWAVLPISHERTKALPFGNYVYDVQVTRADGTVTTLVPCSWFTLAEEVTYDG